MSIRHELQGQERFQDKLKQARPGNDGPDCVSTCNDYVARNYVWRNRWTNRCSPLKTFVDLLIQFRSWEMRFSQRRYGPTNQRTDGRTSYRYAILTDASKKLEIFIPILCWHILKFLLGIPIGNLLLKAYFLTNKAGYTAIQSRTVGQEQEWKNRLEFKNVTDGPTDRHGKV